MSSAGLESVVPWNDLITMREAMKITLRPLERKNELLSGCSVEKFVQRSTCARVYAWSVGRTALLKPPTHSHTHTHTAELMHVEL